MSVAHSSGEPRRHPETDGIVYADDQVKLSRLRFFETAKWKQSSHLRGGAKKRFRVDVFAMEVTEVLDQWPEAHERVRQWLSPLEALALVEEPELAALIRAFAGDQVGTSAASPNMLSSNVAEAKSLASARGP